MGCPKNCQTCEGCYKGTNKQVHPNRWPDPQPLPPLLQSSPSSHGHVLIHTHVVQFVLDFSNIGQSVNDGKHLGL